MRQLLSTLCPVSSVCVGAYCIVSDLMGIEVKKGIQMLVFDTGNLLRAKRGKGIFINLECFRREGMCFVNRYKYK